VTVAEPAAAFDARELFERVMAALTEAAGSAEDLSFDCVRNVGPASSSGQRAGWQIKLELNGEVLSNGSRPLDLLDDLRRLGACFAAARDDLPFDYGWSIDCFLKWDVTLHSGCDRAALDQVFAFVRGEIALDYAPLDACRMATILPAWIEAAAPQTRRLGPSRSSGPTGFASRARPESIVTANPQRIRS
jgi:two-component system chemotaxis sensor kinase CheA